MQSPVLCENERQMNESPHVKNMIDGNMDRVIIKQVLD